MSRTRVRRRRTALVAVGIAVTVAWAGPVASALGGPARLQPVSERRYVVRPGDTLWSVARTIAPSRDPREVVQALLEANGVRAEHLVPGQTLVLATGD